MRIGKNAALRTQMVRQDKCATCQFVMEACTGVVTTVQKYFPNMSDDYYITIVACNGYIEETLTIAELQSGGMVNR